MFRLIGKFVDVLDAIDLGGWLCVLSGLAVVGVTVLAPAWLDVRQLRYERSVLQRQAALLEARRANYKTFIAAVECNDPMLLQRLAWHHLRLVPAGADVVEAVNASTADLAMDAWMRPGPLQLPAIAVAEPMPRSRLARLVLGPPRPWVLAFGGWLILIGLLISPDRTSPAGRGPQRDRQDTGGMPAERSADDSAPVIL